MKTIRSEIITKVVRDLCIRANLVLRSDVLKALRAAYAKEKNRRPRELLAVIIRNAAVARKKSLAICQDTGLPTVFLELGQEVKIKGDLHAAINKGVDSGYREGSLRNSIVNDPIKRGVPGYKAVIVHIDIVPGNKSKITVLPKGFGCENKSQLKMFNPTAGEKEIKRFIIDAVENAGADACPPYVVGVGIGGTADYAMFLAKKALLRKLISSSRHHKRSVVGRMERDLLEHINRLNIGPMGLGGRTTSLGVNILTAPTHIAGLPVAVSISCHALRSASKIL